MKKLLVLLLVTILGISLVGCKAEPTKETSDNNVGFVSTETNSEVAEAENTIIGTWEIELEGGCHTFLYNADHTGTYTSFSSYTEGSEVKYREKQREFRWKYDDTLKCYVFTLQNSGTGAVLYSEIQNDDGNECLIFAGDKYYRRTANTQ